MKSEVLSCKFVLKLLDFFDEVKDFMMSEVVKLFSLAWPGCNSSDSLCVLHSEVQHSTAFDKPPLTVRAASGVVSAWLPVL